MNDNEMMAIKLGFDSIEDMQRYYDLCLGYYKDGVTMTKSMCEEAVKELDWEDLLNAPREYRLEEKIRFDVDGLIESMHFLPDEHEQNTARKNKVGIRNHHPAATIRARTCNGFAPRIFKHRRTSRSP